MDKKEQKIEGSTFAEYPQTKSDNGIKSKENQGEVGYSSVFGEIKPEEGKNENKESTVKQPVETNEPLASFNSGTSAFSSSNINIENKESKEGAAFAEYPQTASFGLKSTANQPVENKKNLTTSTGYNSMEGEYISTSVKVENKESKEEIKSTVPVPTENKPNIEVSTGYNAQEGMYVSTKIENKDSKEGAAFAEYPQTASVGLKSVVKPVETQTNVTTMTYNSATGVYSSSSSGNIQQKNSNEVPIQVQQTQPVLAPLIIQVPANAPIISNNNIPIGNVQGSITITSTTTTTTQTTGIPQIQPQPPNSRQQMPFGQPQPLEGSTFAEYQQTTSHGIKSSSISSGEIQPPTVSRQMPFGQRQPLEGSTFAEYPQTTSHGIKSSSIPSSEVHPPTVSQQMPFGQPQPLEGSTFAEYPQTTSHGIKSSEIQPK